MALISDGFFVGASCRNKVSKLEACLECTSEHHGGKNVQIVEHVVSLVPLQFPQSEVVIIS